MDVSSLRFTKTLALIIFILTKTDVGANMSCGPYPPPYELLPYDETTTERVFQAPVDQKVELSKPYGYCWIYTNVAIANNQGILQCRYKNWGQLTLNSGSKARKLAEFGQVGRTSFEADRRFKEVYESFSYPPTIYNYTSDLICLNTIEYDLIRKVHFWSHTRQTVNFQAFDPTDLVYKGNSCASFNITSEKWRFDPWCMDVCNPVCEQERPGKVYPNENPDNLPVITPPNFEPQNCTGNFIERTPTQKNIERFVRHLWHIRNHGKHSSTTKFYPYHKFGYLYPNGYGYCWILHMEYYQTKISNDQVTWKECEDYYQNSLIATVNTKEKIQKLYNYGRGMRHYLNLTFIPMKYGRLSMLKKDRATGKLIWKSTGQNVNWTSYGDQGHEEDRAQVLYCPFIDFQSERWYSNYPVGICAHNTMVCQQLGHKYPDETPDFQEFSKWSVWSYCSSSCGQGYQYRSRQCHGSYVCVGESKQVKSCNAEMPCAVNGGYTDWLAWGKCSVSCGQGSQSRHRNCTNPAPSHGGTDCEGDSVDIQDCEQDPCPINGGYTDWLDWGKCSASCGRGSQSRYRDCTNPTPRHGGANCEGISQEHQACEEKPCSIDGGYTEWSKWGKCSITCGQGSRYRSRDCTNPAPQHGGKACAGDDREVQECEAQPCPINGGYTEWSEWGACSATCGKGSQQRLRDCTNPPPKHGGADCDDVDVEKQMCESQPCPINGGYTEWSKWSLCSSTCGLGKQIRLRDCTNPVPQYGGAICEGVKEEYQECNSGDCPVNGGFSEWSAWDTCSVTCAIGNQQRSRDCNNPAPEHGGKECDGEWSETKKCVMSPCPTPDRECAENFVYFGGRCLSISTSKHHYRKADFPCEDLGGFRAAITSKEDAKIIIGFLKSRNLHKKVYFLSPLHLSHNGKVTWKSTGQNADYIANLLSIPKTYKGRRNVVPIVTPQGEIGICDSKDCYGRTLCQQQDSVYYGDPNDEENSNDYD